MKQLPPNYRGTVSKRVVRVVKGPIRCHKCQRSCQDAAEYLNHKCEQPSSHSDAQTRRFVESIANGTYSTSIR